MLALFCLLRFLCLYLFKQQDANTTVPTPAVYVIID